MGTHPMPFSSQIYIERSDFREADEKGFYGMAPGKEVHLKYTAVYLTCTDVKKGPDGLVSEITCSLSETAPESREPAEPKIKGHLHWVSAQHGAACTINLYDYLFSKEAPEASVEGEEAPVEAAEEEGAEEEVAAEGPSFVDNLNPDSLIVKTGYCEPDLLAYADKPGTSFQFERVGFFAVDKDSTKAKPIFNRVVTLKESKDKKSL